MDAGNNAYRLSRHRLPSGQSHLAKRSDLDAALMLVPDLEIESVTLWPASQRPADRFFAAHGWRGSSPVSAEAAWLPLTVTSWFGLDDARGGYHRPFTAWLSLYAVPSSRRAELRAVLLDQALPSALDWAAAIAAGAQTARTERHQHFQGLVDGQMRNMTC